MTNRLPCPSRFAAIALLGGLVGAACRDEPRPWKGAVPTAVEAPSGFLPGDGQPSLLSGAFGGAGGDDGVPEAAVTEPHAARGALWQTCAAGFRTTGRPLVDVTRLGLLCGPINGMSRRLGPRQGELRPTRPQHLDLELKAGECLRVIATADDAVSDIDVILRDPAGGATLARDDTDGRWAVADPDRPLCVRDAVTLDLELSAPQRGRYAVEVWALTADR